MIHDRNIVCVASNWFDHPTSKHHIMRHLSERNHVLWVNFHGSRCPQLTRGDAHMVFHRLRQTWTGARRVTPQLDVLSPLVIPMPTVRLIRSINGRVLARQIAGALRQLPQRPTQLWLFTPDVPDLIGQLDVERVVYYCVDDFAAFSGYNTALMETLEGCTIAASDVVITTSSKLYEERCDGHPNVHLVPHGVDYEHFAATPQLPRTAIPGDLKRLRQPVLGYMGLITDYMDWPLLAQAARVRPEWSFVLLGDVRCDVSAVAGLQNVHLLGGRPYEQLPAYCRGFDVGLIPFRMNRLTRAVNPIKLREYLAAGLPVVSAPLATVERYRPAVQTAGNLDEFLAACDIALKMATDGNGRARQELVRTEGWRARVELLSELVAAGPRRETAVRSPAPVAR